MIRVLLQLAQAGEGFDWYEILIAVVVLSLPVLNGIKDWFVKHAEKDRAARQQLSKALQRAVGSETSGEFRPPVAKPMPVRPATTGKTTGLASLPREAPPAPTQRAERATPQSIARRKAMSAAESVAGATAKAASRQSRPKPAEGRKRAAPSPQTGKRSRQLEQPNAARVIAVDVQEVVPILGLPEAAPKVAAESARPKIDIRAARIQPTTETGQLAKVKPTAEELRRFIIMSEVLGPPVALRNPAWGASGLSS